MKLRQKLAMVLAAAMIVTAVPVTTMAKTTNTLSKTVSVVAGTDISDRDVFLNIKADADVQGNEVFFIKAHDFEFNNEAAYTVSVADKKYDDALAAVTTNAVTEALAKKYTTVGTVTVTSSVTGAYGSKNEITAISVDGLGTTTGAVTVYDANTNLVGGLMDTYNTAKKNFTAAATANATATITWLDATTLKVQLPTTVANGTSGSTFKVPVYGKAKAGNPMLEVVSEDSHISASTHLIAGSEVVSEKTIAATAGDPTNISVEGAGTISDIVLSEKVLNQLAGQKITIKLPNASELKFKGGNVKFEGKMGLAGALSKTQDTINVLSNGNEIEITVPTLLAGAGGAKGSVVLKGIEVVAKNPRKDCKVGEVKVTVKNTKMDDTVLHVANIVEYGVGFEVKEEIAPIAGREAKTVRVTLDEKALGTLNQKYGVYLELDNAEIVKGSYKIVEGRATIDHELDKKENVKNLRIDFSTLNTTETNKVVFEFDVVAKAATAGEINMIASSRNFEEDMTVKLGEVKDAVVVEAEATTVKVGLQGQKGGEIVITETEAEMLPRDKEIVLQINTGKTEGINLVGAKVTAEDIEIKEVKVKNGQISFVIDSESEELGKITISDIVIDTNRMVPEGKFDLVIGGDAISVDNTTTDVFEDVITVKDFVVIGTKNTEDNNGLKGGVAVFTNGAKTFLHNDKEVEMDVAPYIVEKSGRMMIPVRYLSEAFGIEGSAIRFNEGTVTMFIGQRVVQLSNNDKFVIINGVKVPMDEAMTIKDDRSFVPVGELARILGVEVDFNNTTKTATFSN